MGLELWAETSAAISAVAGSWERRPRDQHPTAPIVRAYHWAAPHDRPVSWAGKAKPRPVKAVDGKPLELPNPGTGRDAAWGRGVSRLGLGYKVHAVFLGNPMPTRWRSPR